MIQKSTTHHTNLFWTLLVILHLAVMFFLYTRFGVNYSNEGAKYLDQATNLITGKSHLTFRYSSFYSFYVLYLSAFIYFKIPLIFIFLCTYVLSLFAYNKFYQLLKHLFSVNVAKIWLACMLLSPLIQYWQFNLFSETFFIALCLLYIPIFLSPIQPYRFLKIGLLTIPLLLSRPNSVFIIGISILIYLYQQKVFSKQTIIFASLILSVVLFFGVVFLFPLPYRDFSFQIVSGSVYCGFPTFNYTTLPEGNYTLWECYSSIYHSHGLWELAQLFIKKGLSFFITSRPYYSSFHNVLNRAHDVFYVLGIASIYTTYKWKQKEFSFLLLLLLIVVLNALMVSLIYNEWSERHTVQVFPFIFVGAAVSINIILQKLKLISNSNK